MRVAGIIAAAVLAGCGGGGGGGGEGNQEPIDIHQGEVFLQFRNHCNLPISQLWYCPCPPPEYPIPVDYWTKVDLPLKGYTGGNEPIYEIGRMETVAIGWVPIGPYAFLWRTEEDWLTRYEPIPPDLPDPPLEWSTWNSKACYEIFPVLSIDPHSDKKDMIEISLTCPGYGG